MRIPLPVWQDRNYFIKLSASCFQKYIIGMLLEEKEIKQKKTLKDSGIYQA